MKNLLLVVILCFAVPAFSQEGEDIRLFPTSGDTTKKTDQNDKGKKTGFDLDFTSKKGEVKVSQDERIPVLSEFVGTPQKNEPGVKIRGYRLQLFFNPDKDKVNQKRSDYLARHSDHPAYIDYLAPNFRLRAGNFRVKLQAQQWQDELKVDFPDAIIVEDWIELPELKTEKK